MHPLSLSRKLTYTHWLSAAAGWNSSRGINSLGDGDEHDPHKQQTADFISVRSHDVS